MHIVEATTAADFAIAGTLFREYETDIGISLGFQGFEQELATLPGRYARPSGCILFAVDDHEPAGCVAVRPLDEGVSEMKRLYVRPAYRRRKVGRLLAEAIVEEARKMGEYRVMRLDTLGTMDAALGLYRSLGFKDIPPYTHNPIENAVFLELLL